MLTTQTNVVRFTIVQSITAYDFSFPFWDFSQIVVRVSNETGEPVELTRDVDYTLTVSEPLTDLVYQDGTITMISDAFRSYETLIIARELALEQDTQYPNGQPVNGEIIESSFDKLVAMMQQINEGVSRSVQLPISESTSSMELPPAEDRKNGALGFDENGNPTIYANPDEVIETATEQNAQAQQALVQISEIGVQVSEDKAAVEEMKAEIEATVHPGYRETIGDGTTTEFTITHNLHAEWVVTQVWYKDLTKAYPYQINEIDQNSLEIAFQTAPETDGVEVRIISAQRVDIAELPDDFQVKPENIAPETVLTTEEIQQIISILTKGRS